MHSCERRITGFYFQLGDSDVWWWQGGEEEIGVIILRVQGSQLGTPSTTQANLYLCGTFPVSDRAPLCSPGSPVRTSGSPSAASTLLIDSLQSLVILRHCAVKERVIMGTGGWLRSSESLLVQMDYCLVRLNFLIIDFQMRGYIVFFCFGSV